MVPNDLQPEAIFSPTKPTVFLTVRPTNFIVLNLFGQASTETTFNELEAKSIKPNIVNIFFMIIVEISNILSKAFYIDFYRPKGLVRLAVLSLFQG